VIRAFEKIFDLIPPEFIDQQQQIDELTTALADVLAELSIVPQLGELQARVAELAKEIQDLKQGVVI
jgi:cell division protein FtsB